jgi:modulator of FtsH protease
MKAGHSIPTMWSFTRALLSSAPSIPIVVAGALLMLGWGGGLYWIAAGVILSLVAGILTAWVLLIEILR